MIQRKKRHPFRGLLFGLLLGVGLGMMAIIYGLYFAGPLTPWILVAVGVIIGLVMVFVPAPWGRRPPPAPTAEA
jgi:drug/metabolite transporter (DMT)-like permease